MVSCGPWTQFWFKCIWIRPPSHHTHSYYIVFSVNCLLLHCFFQTENGLVETVAVLVSEMPRMRPNLSNGKLGQCYKSKSDFVKVQMHMILIVCILCYLYFMQRRGGDKSYFAPIADNNIFIFAFALIHVLMSRHGRNGEVI